MDITIHLPNFMQILGYALGAFAGIGIAVTAVALYRLATVGFYLFVRWAWRPRRG